MTPMDHFRIRAHVPDFEAISEGYRTTSGKARSRWRAHRDIAYGVTAAERLDLFSPDGVVSERPIHMFVHGGYWRAM